MTNQWDPKSPWSDVRVRKAASLAIDRQTLADVHMPGCVPVGTIGSDDDPSVVNIPVDPYDPEKAKKLLAEAGYPNGFQGGPFYPYEGGYWPYGEQVANYWKAIGITVDSQLLDRPALLAQHRSKKMKGATFIEPIHASECGNEVSYLFTDTSYGNYPDIQDLWDQYNKAIDPKDSERPHRPRPEADSRKGHVPSSYADQYADGLRPQGKGESFQDSAAPSGSPVPLKTWSW